MTRTSFGPALLSAALFLSAAPATGQVVLPYGTFQEIFATADQTTQASSNVSDYNNFVTAEAALSTGLPGGVTWTAILSTNRVAANVNAPSGGFPVYNTAGVLVSKNDNLYSGSLASAVKYDQYGTALTSFFTWTGSDASGNPLAPVGNPTVKLGDVISTTGNWLSDFTASEPPGATAHLYALSSPITNLPSTAAVSSNSPIPGGTGNFTSFSTPTLDGGGTAFFGAGSGGQQGIYITTPPGPLFPPGPLKMADLNTAIPGGTGNFTSFTVNGAPPGPLISGQNVAFFGAGSGGQQGIYGVFPPSPLLPPGPIAPPAPIKLVDLNTAIPGGVGNFTGFLPPGPLAPPNPMISGQNVAFFGAGSGGQEGIYASYVTDTLHPPEPVKIADLNTAIPGGVGNFTSLPPSPIINGLNVAFVGNGSGGQTGIYAAFPPVPLIPPAPIKIADTTTAIPGGAGNFTSFNQSLSLVGQSLAFIGTGSGQQGVYLQNNPNPLQPGSPLKMIADLNTAIPGGTGTFSGFTAVSTTGTDTAFLGTGSGGQSGIYDRTAAGALLDVVSVGQLLNGKTITSLSFNNAGLSGDPTIAFQATFSDGSTGNFTLSVPEPSGALLLVMGVVMLGAATHGDEPQHGPDSLTFVELA